MERAETEALGLWDSPQLQEYHLEAAWVPPACEGHASVYSQVLDAIVLCGGLAPGKRQINEVSICRLRPAASGTQAESKEAAPLVPLWRSLTIGKKKGQRSGMPPRCYHGCALVEAAGEGSFLFVFGGENSRYPDGKNECLNDSWMVDLATGTARALIPHTGSPPAPRMHHTVDAMLDSANPCLLVIGGRRVTGELFEELDSLHFLWLDAPVGSEPSAAEAAGATKAAAADKSRDGKTSGGSSPRSPRRKSLVERDASRTGWWESGEKAMMRMQHRCAPRDATRDARGAVR